MPVAPSFEELYNFEGNIETCFAAIFEGALAQRGYSAQVLKSISPDSKITPRFQIVFNANTPFSLNRTTLGQANPAQIPNNFTGSLSVKLYTTRSISSDNADMHGLLRGLARFLGSGIKLFNNSNMPYYQILQILPTGCNNTIADEKQQDGTELTWDVLFAIDNSAWPST